jgi:hypothetical protein
MTPTTPTPKSPADESLLDYAREIRTVRETMKRPPEFVYSCTEDFLIKRGEFFTPSGLPSSMRPMKLSQCFENAWRVAQRTKAYHYVEGIAMGMIPTWHAWLIDRDGNAYDPTWTSLDSGIGTSYFGVELNLDEVRLTRRGGCASLLDDYRRKFPALTGVEVVSKDGWFTR